MFAHNINGITSLESIISIKLKMFTVLSTFNSTNRKSIFAVLLTSINSDKMNE